MSPTDKGRVWQVSVVTSPEAEEAVIALMERVLGTAPVSFHGTDGSATVALSSYVLETAMTEGLRPELEEGLRRIEACGLDTRPAQIGTHEVQSQDWAESWKKNFEPFSIRGSLLIKPSWSKRAPTTDETVVVLDPGLSFGTGQHPTTRFCLDQIVSAWRTFESPSLLDIGTGSGLLAIAAARLGYKPVEAFDNDPQAIETASWNAKANNVLDRIELHCSDIEALPPTAPRQYSLVCANLFQPLLLKAADAILARLIPSGTLVLAGILESEFGEVHARYQAAGWELVADHVEDDWRSGSFRRRADDFS